MGLMGLFKKKKRLGITELKCPAEGCPFTCSDSITLKKHTNWKHPELVKIATK